MIPNTSNGHSFTPPTMMPSLPPLAPSVGTLSDTGAVVVQLSDSTGQPRSHVSSTATERVSMISATRGVVNVEIRRDGGIEDSSEYMNASTDGMGMHGVNGINGRPFLNESEIGDGRQDFGQKPEKNSYKNSSTIHHNSATTNNNTLDLHLQ